ncbi:hypothetical protein TKK_0016019 [Trichogramma kaykai]|uniref:Uncharacterized protein n=1 Tax=Trichogramma kaykai TaxID=54128 RepID=A0ABD2W971_9HYME
MLRPILLLFSTLVLLTEAASHHSEHDSGLDFSDINKDFDIDLKEFQKEMNKSYEEELLPIFENAFQFIKTFFDYVHEAARNDHEDPRPTLYFDYHINRFKYAQPGQLSKVEEIENLVGLRFLFTYMKDDILRKIEDKNMQKKFDKMIGAFNPTEAKFIELWQTLYVLQNGFLKTTTQNFTNNMFFHPTNRVNGL